jgi:hypothetical protein
MAGSSPTGNPLCAADSPAPADLVHDHISGRGRRGELRLMWILEAIRAWPLSAWLAILPLIGAALWTPIKALLERSEHHDQAQLEHDASALEQMVARCQNLEDIVDVLRVALDRGRIRENALITVAELMLFGIRHLHDTPEIAALKLRCEEILRAARHHAAGEFSSRGGQ